MSLEDWLTNGWLIRHDTAPQEIRQLLAVADRDLADCRAEGLSPDWKLNIAYNAALQLATAALAAAGFRAGREAHHYRVIQSLAFTVGADAELIAQLDQFRKKRNLSEYDRAGAVSGQEAREMAELAERLRGTVLGWLREEHTRLL